MKFQIFRFYKTALCLAIENNDIDMINLLLSFDQLDINLSTIIFYYFYIIPHFLFLIKPNIQAFIIILIYYIIFL